MNKIKYFIYLFLFVCIFSISSNIYAKEMVYIRSAELDSKSDGASENSAIKFDGLDVDVNIKFTEINDYVKYKINIKNRSNKDYIISNKNITNISDYMSYELTFDDDSDIVKAGTNKVVYLTIKYKNEVPEEKLVSTYTEDKNFNIELQNEDGTAAKIENPKTGIESVIPMLIIAVSGVVAFIVLRKHTRSKMLVLILLVSLLPLGAYALETITIDIDSKVEIDATKEFCYITGIYTDFLKVYYKYRDGMTWQEYLDSDYNKITENTTLKTDNNTVKFADYLDKCNNYFNQDWNPKYLFSYNNSLGKYGFNNHEYFSYIPNYFYDIYGIRNYIGDSDSDILNTKIQDSSNGCYYSVLDRQEK